MPKLKGMAWRLIYAVLVIVFVMFVIPLLFQLLGVSLPITDGPAFMLLKFAVVVLIVIFIFVGPETWYPF